jgi:hypothetical protein
MTTTETVLAAYAKNKGWEPAHDENWPFKYYNPKEEIYYNTKIDLAFCNEMLQLTEEEECIECNGNGRLAIIPDPCPVCNATGRIDKPLIDAERYLDALYTIIKRPIIREKLGKKECLVNGAIIAIHTATVEQRIEAMGSVLRAK